MVDFSEEIRGVCLETIKEKNQKRKEQEDQRRKEQYIRSKVLSRRNKYFDEAKTIFLQAVEGIQKTGWFAKIELERFTSSDTGTYCYTKLALLVSNKEQFLTKEKCSNFCLQINYSNDNEIKITRQIIPGANEIIVKNINIYNFELENLKKLIEVELKTHIRETLRY